MRKMRNYKNQLLIICLAVGFFVGILYQNILNGKEVIINELFLISNLQRYLQAKVVADKLLIYVIKERVLGLGFIVLFGCMKWKKAVPLVAVSVLGFLFGAMCVSSVLQLGLKGLLLCVAIVLPHGIFYGIQYSVLFTYWYQFPTIQWNHIKSVFVALVFILGILFEVYVNPMLVKWVIRIII